MAIKYCEEYPEVVALCTNCAKPTCSGDCADRRKLTAQMMVKYGDVIDSKKGKEFEVDGKRFTTFDLMAEYGVDPNTIRYWIRNGFTIKQILQKLEDRKGCLQ